MASSTTLTALLVLSVVAAAAAAAGKTRPQKMNLHLGALPEPAMPEDTVRWGGMDVPRPSATYMRPPSERVSEHDWPDMSFPRAPGSEGTTALDTYVHAPDTHYHWVDTGLTFKGVGFKGYILNVTSQGYLNATTVSCSVWWHYFVVVVPDLIEFPKNGAMYITGGDNTDSPPKEDSEDVLFCISMAILDRVTCGTLFQVPNQPCVFANDPTQKKRSEDSQIAWTWWNFQANPDEYTNWLSRLPMTKAAVRAMDAMTEFMAKKEKKDLSEFIVFGASKRGWTTWTTGAVDSRVVAIGPIVMDALNFVENVHHMYRNLGGWTFAFKDYYALNFTRFLDHPNTQAMSDIIDPYVYRERLTMPKLVMDSGGDEFFQPDDNHFWWNDMVGELHLMFVPNAEHSMATGIPELAQSLSSFIFGVLTKDVAPEMKWQLIKSNTTASIHVQTSEPPMHIIAWYATTLDSKRRDWRLITGQSPCPYPQIDGACPHPVFWAEHKVTNGTGVNNYTVSFDAPADNKWTAFFIDVKWKHQVTFSLPWMFTTQVNIVPDRYAFDDCHNDGCLGELL